ncbi:hypothetical protein [Rhodococcus opacus]|uniref:hypothetical protein n=1 Tax=Rhodococcus opacus TaxID=37919 RepID=UPI0010571D51|nr:hypothetical protein [Rhodococcus opacus]
MTAWIDLGLGLRHQLHGTRVAFATGRIDLDQARVIAAILAGVSDSKLEQVETAILDGRSLPPSTLRARARRLIARHDPDSIARRTTLAVADRDVGTRRAPLVQVVVNASTLLGLDDLPAHLEGYGPICPQVLRTGRYPQRTPRVHWPPTVSSSASTRWPPKAMQVGTSLGSAPFRRLTAYP